MWGASDLFDKLTDFHNQSVVSISFSHDSSLKDVVEEFVCIISEKSKSKDTSKSIITRLQSCGKTIPLHSEMKTNLQDGGELPHIFWRNLLGGQCPMWKFVSESTPRHRKRPNYLLGSSSLGTSVDAAGGVKTRRKTIVTNNTIEPAKSKPVTEEAETGGLNEQGGSSSEVPAHNESQSLSGDRFWSTAVTNETSLYDQLKPTVFELCNVLKFLEDVKVIVQRFLKYVLENYNVPKEQTSTLQAFMISVCWIGSSLAQLKIDRRESFAVAKKHFHFSCMEEQTDSEYKKLKPVKGMFLQHSELPTDALKDDIIPGPGSQEPVRLEEETENCQEHTHSESFNREEDPNRCKNQTEHLSCKDGQQEFNKEWENKRVGLENDYQVDKALICTLHRSNPSIRSEKIKLLDKEFTNKLEQHKRLRETRLEDLKAKLASLNGQNQVVAAPSAQGNNIESPGSHTSGKQTTNSTVSLPREAPAPQSYDGMEVDDVAGKADLGVPEVDSHQENATATSSIPNRSHAVEHCSETGTNVESGDTGMPAGNCYNENAETSSHANQDRGPDDNDVVLPVPAEMEEQAGNFDKEVAVICPSDTLHACEEDHNETNLADSALMETPAGNCNEDTGPDDASHDTAKERNNDSSSNPPSTAAVSQDNAASVDEPGVASVAIIPEIQNECLAERSIEDNEGEASPSLFAEIIVDDVQALGDGCDIHEIVPEEDPLLEPRNDEEATLADGNLEQRDVVADGERQPSSVTDLNMFDNLNNRVGSRMASQTADSLQVEVERLYDVKDAVAKFHEETKQRLTSECEKEIAEMTAQINLKYEGKRQEAEAAYNVKRKQLESNIIRVIMNRMLAKAFRSK